MPRSASAPAASTRFRTVEELVKVMQSGRLRQDVARPAPRRSFGRDGAVGLHDVHARAAAGEFVGHEVAGDGGARQQDALAGQVVSGEGFQQAFGDVLLAHQVHLEVQRFDGGARGRADGADAWRAACAGRRRWSRRSRKKRTPLALVKISQS